MMVTGQPMPCGQYPFHVFPLVSLREILRTDPANGSEADDAYSAINSKRCDLLLTDRNGFPFAALEYQGSGPPLPPERRPPSRAPVFGYPNDPAAKLSAGYLDTNPGGTRFSARCDTVAK
jgi:hypothetical protein